MFRLDEFRPLNLQSRPGRQWAERGGKGKDPDREPRPRRRATCTRPYDIRRLLAACTPTNSSWLNRIEAQFTALRHFTLDNTDHASRKEHGSMIRLYLIWRNRHADDRRLRAEVARANVA